MKVRHFAKRSSEMSHVSSMARMCGYDDYWSPDWGYCQDEDAGYEQESDYDDFCDHGVLYCDNCERCEEDLGDIDTCLGCGRAYGTHAGLAAWDQRREGSIAPQLCSRCWNEQGYA